MPDAPHSTISPSTHVMMAATLEIKMQLLV